MLTRIGIWTVAAVLAMTTVAFAAKGKLDGFQEVPAISTPASGKCTVKAVDGALAVTLEYANLVGAVQQAHVHLGNLGVNGGIAFFICTNLGNGPMGTPACPAPPATVTRTIATVDIIGPTGQGLAAGNLAALVTAIKKKSTYCDVHSTSFPGGEIRAQLK